MACRYGTAAIVVLACWIGALRTCRATSLGSDGSHLATSAYALDLFQGPVYAGTRMTGLAGAYVAISEDVDGDLQNPASPAVRPFYSYSDFDYWLGFGLTFPATLSGLDFFNSGKSTALANQPRSFVFFTPAVNLQWGEFGTGVNVAVQRYEIGNASTGETATVTIPTTHLQFAHGIAHNQVVLGVGARLLSMSVSEAATNDAKFSSSGFGIELGAVIKPENRPYRFGVAFRSGIRTEARYSEGLLPNANGDLVVAGQGGNVVYLPEAVALPWDLNFGVAVQLGKRPFNEPWRPSAELIERETITHRLRQLDREDARNTALQSARPDERSAIDQKFDRDQREDDNWLSRRLRDAVDRQESRLREMNRFYVQLSASAVISGPTEKTLGVESLVSQSVLHSGQLTVISPRLGVETGVVPEWLKVRAGTYLEPTRFDTSSARLHGTLGVDIKLLRWNVFGLWPEDYMWRIGLVGDVASRYYTWGVSLGGWYPRRGSSAPDASPATGTGMTPAAL